MKKLPEVITFEEFVKIMRATKKKHHKLAFALGFFCCLRISEVTKLKPENVDLERGYLFIQEAKGGKDRYVPIAKPLRTQLKYLPVGVCNRALQFKINEISKKVLGKKIHFHTLRHSGATHYLKNDMNIREIQNLLGHSRLDTTMIYTHVSPENIKERMDNIWN